MQPLKINQILFFSNGNHNVSLKASTTRLVFGTMRYDTIRFPYSLSHIRLLSFSTIFVYVLFLPFDFNVSQIAWNIWITKMTMPFYRYFYIFLAKSDKIKIRTNFLSHAPSPLSHIEIWQNSFPDWVEWSTHTERAV